MSIFDDVFESSTPQGITKQEAFMGILLSANASDGHISDEEVQGLFTILGRMKLYQNWNQDKWRRSIDRMLGLLKRKGLDDALRTCAEALPPELAPTAFANAVDLVLADGVVEDSEKEFINKLWRTLKISGDDAKTIAQVMVVKNKG